MTRPKFEELRKNESGSLFTFYERFDELTNEALSLGRPIDETTVVHKILRTLPKRFKAQKIVLQELQDLNEIKLGKLVGKLRHGLWITIYLQREQDR